MAEIPEKNNNYVDNAALYAAIVEFRKVQKEAAEKGLPPPKMPEFIGECILKIAKKFSLSAQYKKNFAQYPFREDMVMDGVETCVRYFHNFDVERFTNPFAYFTQICYYSFLNRIRKEKKTLYNKFKLIQNQREIGIMADSQEHEELSDFGVNIQENNDYMNDFIRSYEDNADAKAAKVVVPKKTKKGAGTLDVLEDEEVELDVDVEFVDTEE